jgi:hypothetical protein
MPTYVVGERRLHVGVWKHGLSLYGWSADRSGGFCERYPNLCGDEGTLKLLHEDAARDPRRPPPRPGPRRARPLTVHQPSAAPPSGGAVVERTVSSPTSSRATVS